MARERTGASSFDELAVGLASGEVSRRRALRLMGAALVGGTLGSLGGVAGADLCKPNGKVCKKNQQCCSGNCDSSKKCAPACASGQVLCNGNCVSNSCLTNSGQVFNTSTCQCECPTDRVKLSNGTCAKPCAFGTADCDGCGIGCAEDVLGSRYCISGVVDSAPPCANDSGCPSGEICINVPAPIGSPPTVCAAAC
jgi:hypothetical protein